MLSQECMKNDMENNNELIEGQKEVTNKPFPFKLWQVILFIAFVFYGLSNCLGCDDSTKDEEFAGTYEIVDKTKQIYVLTLKEDKTATMVAKGSSKTYYCSWNYYDLYTEPHVEIHFSDDPPALVFDGGVAITMWNPKMQDNWLYFDYDARKAKNPKRRLPIKKIK